MENGQIYLDASSVASKLGGAAQLCDLVSWLAPLPPDVLAAVVRSDVPRFAEYAGQLEQQAEYLKGLGGALAAFSARLKGTAS
jgi:hypothetical protein